MTASVGRIRERIWAAHPELLALGASGPSPSRAIVRIGPIVGVDFGVDEYWGVQITSGMHLPDPDAARAAMEWARSRDRGSGWCASVPAALVAQGPWAGLAPIDSLTMWAIDVATARDLPLHQPAGVELVMDPTLDDVLAAYGGWMDDAGLARQLVQPGDLERQGRRCIVARFDGVAVGCGFVWWAGGTAYLSGIGVVEGLRGQGIGYALTSAAARLAVTWNVPEPPSVVWMHATDDGAALYARMGFTKVDTEVQVGPPTRS
jgi:GNAT superfamily N-acetyltransferase